MSGFFDSIPDELDEVLSAPVVAPTAPPSSYRPKVVEPCAKCGGTGRYRNYGPCFSCKGKGSLTFPNPAPVRQERREAARQRESDRRDEALTAFEREHPDVYRWINKSAATFEFAASLRSALSRYGHLTPNQFAAAQRCAARDAARNVERAAEQQAVTAVAAAAPRIEMSKIEEAFETAEASGLRRIHLRLDTFHFKPAGQRSRYPGAVFVTDHEDQYLGRISDGRFFNSRACGSEQMDRILAAIADPHAAAVAYGKRFGECAICGRTLTDPVSVERGIGPICAGRFGW